MIVSKAFRAMAFQVVVSSLFGVFFIMVTHDQGVSIFPFLLVFFAAACAALDAAFLSRRREKKSVLAFNGMLSLLFTLAVFFLFPRAEILERLMSLPVAVFFSAYSVRLASDDVSYRTFLRLLDLSIAIFIIAAICGSIRSYPVEMTYMAATATAVSLLSVLLLRHGGTGAGGWISTMLLILSLVLLVFLLAGYAPAAGESVMALWRLVQRFFNGIYDFINWLFGLLPGGEAKPGQNLIPVVTDDPYRKHETLTAALPDKVFQILLFVVLTSCAAVLLLYWIRRVRFSRRGMGGKKQKSSTVSVSRGILMGLSSLGLMIRTRVFIFMNRNNSVGLYFWLSRVLRKDDLGKRSSETPREFLFRLSPFVPGHDLEKLADDVELVFYSGTKHVPSEVPCAASVRRKFLLLATSRRCNAIVERLRSRIMHRRCPER